MSETGITFNRVYWSFSLGVSRGRYLADIKTDILLQLAATQTYSISDTDGLVATGFTFAFDTSSHGVILAVSRVHLLVSVWLTDRAFVERCIDTLGIDRMADDSAHHVQRCDTERYGGNTNVDEGGELGKHRSGEVYRSRRETGRGDETDPGG